MTNDEFRMAKEFPMTNDQFQRGAVVRLQRALKDSPSSAFKPACPLFVIPALPFFSHWEFVIRHSWFCSGVRLHHALTRLRHTIAAVHPV